MAKFIYLYRGPAPDPAPEQASERMAAFGAWVEKVGAALVDVGSPFGRSASVRDDGTEGTAGDLIGYTIVEVTISLQRTHSPTASRFCPRATGGARWRSSNYWRCSNNGPPLGEGILSRWHRGFCPVGEGRVGRVPPTYSPNGRSGSPLPPPIGRWPSARFATRLPSSMPPVTIRCARCSCSLGARAGSPRSRTCST